MLIPRNALGNSADGRQGRHPVDWTQLRSELADPERMSPDSQQRLMELNHKLDRLRALGDEYTEVELSEWAQAALQTDRKVS
jgi:hypothetical protein